MTSDNKDQGAGAGEDRTSIDVTLARLRAHIKSLEEELAIYASKYGLTDKARELLARPVDR